MPSNTSHKPYRWIPSLYVAEALPYVAVMVMATTLYKRMELSNTELALYTSWLYLPWVIKPLWSPFLAALHTERWWVMAMQLLVGAGFAGIALTLPTAFWLQGSLAFFWLLAFASATHDIAADGLYIIGLDTSEQSLYIGVRSTFYRIGMILGQGALVMLAGRLEHYMAVPMAWSITFALMAACFLCLFLWHRYALPTVVPHTEGFSVRHLLSEFWLSLTTFFSKPHIVPALLFMLLFRFPEGQLVKIANPFIIDSVDNGGLGMDTEDVGFIYGTLGVIGLLGGGLIGGYLVSRDGLSRWLWPMVLAISVPDAVYVLLSAVSSHSFLLVSSCVLIEQIGYGFGFTAYSLFLVNFSKGERSTAIFSLCTAMQALGMMVPGMVAGYMADHLGYFRFFCWILACCLVTFAVTAFIKVDPSFGRKQ